MTVPRLLALDAAGLPGGDDFQTCRSIAANGSSRRDLFASNHAADRAKTSPSCNVAKGRPQASRGVRRYRSRCSQRAAGSFIRRRATRARSPRPHQRTETEGGSGSGRSRFKRRKSGTLVCLESHLECKSVDVPCSCRPAARTNRRRAMRSDPRGFEPCHACRRGSAGAAAILSAACLGASDALEIAAMALESALPYRVAAAAYLAAKPCPACPDKPRGILCVACATVKCGFRPLGASRRRPALSMVSLVIA